MRILSWIVVLIGIAGLIGVRVEEDRFFYDPFLRFFNEVDKKNAFPDFQWWKLIYNHIFRFLLNLFFSALIIQFIFRKISWTVQGILMITVVFLVTFPIYLYCISTHFEVGYLFSFYMRRFVIQPIILLLIIPLFYYRKVMESKTS